MAKKYGQPTRDDISAIARSAPDQSVFTKHFFNWEPMGWQQAFAHASQPRVCALGGAGSGKTLGVTMGALWLASTIPYFKFLNVSYTAWQAGIPFKILQAHIENSGYSRLLRCRPKTRPYPIFELWNGSTLEFLTLGRDAAALRGGEWDWINFDEGGLCIDPYPISVLYTRLRGQRATGKTRLGRFSVTTTPTAAGWLKEMYWKGVRDSASYHPSYASIKVRTKDNEHLTEEQVLNMAEGMMSEEMKRVEMDAEFPEVESRIFSETDYVACENPSLNDLASELAEDGKATYLQTPAGLVRYELPPDPKHTYILSGDGGTGNAPKRGAPVIEVWDVTARPWRLSAFWWMSGYGKWEPFLAGVEELHKKYNAQPYVDATGPQTIVPEMLQRRGVPAIGLYMNKDKAPGITQLQHYIQQKRVEYPYIQGRRAQYVQYELPDDKIAQDIVMAGVQAGLALRLMEVEHESSKDSGDRYERRKKPAPSRNRSQSRRDTEGEDFIPRWS